MVEGYCYTGIKTHIINPYILILSLLKVIIFAADNNSSLPNENNLNLSKLKAVAGNKINATFFF